METKKDDNQSGNRIIITSKEQTYAFDKNTYKEELLSGLITRLEYDKIIESASKIMGHSWTKKRVNDQIKLPKFVIILSLIAIVLTIIYMVLLYLSATSKNGTTMLIIAIICVAGGSLIAFGLSIYNFCRKIGKFKSLEDIIKEDLDQYLNEINKNFLPKLEFIFNVNKRWIEVNVKGNKNNTNTYNFMDTKRDNNIISEENELNYERIKKKNVVPVGAHHSRAQSNFPEGRKGHSKTPSIIDKIVGTFHSRSPSVAGYQRPVEELENSNRAPLKNKDN